MGALAIGPLAEVLPAIVPPWLPPGHRDEPAKPAFPSVLHCTRAAHIGSNLTTNECKNRSGANFISELRLRRVIPPQHLRRLVPPRWTD